MRRVPFHPVLQGHAMLLLDPLCVVGSAVVAAALKAGTPSAGATAVAAVAATFILYDGRLGAMALQGRLQQLLGAHALRFAVLAAVLLGLAAASRTLAAFPADLLVAWFGSSLASTALARVGVARLLQRLQRRGAFAEHVAVVGDGDCAQRVVQALTASGPHAVELLGVFDDAALAQLIALGQRRRIDCILLALPPDSQPRLARLLQRLKALAVPIGLCPQQLDPPPQRHAVALIGDQVSVALLAGDSADDDDSPVPRWIATLGLLVAATVDAGARQVVVGCRGFGGPAGARRVLSFDAHDLASFTDVASRFGSQDYGYAVTPNADHVIRLDESAPFRDLYAAADFVLLDSRFLANLLRVTRGLQLPVCPGSDLVTALFRDVIAGDDHLVLIGGSDAQAQRLAALHGLTQLAHFNPPMGFIRDPEAVEDCLRFIEAHSPFRYCLLAVGAPQQETLAHLLKARGRARGLALCIGASINFLTGDEQRAPAWMRRAGIEWSFRLMQDPRRMAGRYLVRGPRVFAVLRRAEIVLRQPAAVLRLVPPPAPAAPPEPVPLAGVEMQG